MPSRKNAMKFQSRKFTCGPAAICNALEVYGEYLAEADVAERCKTTVDGTTSRGLVAGIRSYGYDVEPLKFRDSLLALRSIQDGFPSVLCVDNWSHWISIVGISGQRAVICDSASSHLVEFPRWEALVSRWKYTGSRYEGYRIIKTLQTIYKKEYNVPTGV